MQTNPHPVPLRQAKKNRNQIVKNCPKCGLPIGIHDFFKRKELKPIGMAFHTETFDRAFYYFMHDTSQCGTSFVVPVLEFIDLLEEAIPNELAAETQKCPGYCTTIDDLSMCQAECTRAPFRRLLLKMK